MNLFGLGPRVEAEAGQARMNFNDLANLLDNDGRNQAERDTLVKINFLLKVISRMR